MKTVELRRESGRGRRRSLPWLCLFNRLLAGYDGLAGEGWSESHPQELGGHRIEGAEDRIHDDDDDRFVNKIDSMKFWAGVYDFWSLKSQILIYIEWINGFLPCCFVVWVYFTGSIHLKLIIPWLVCFFDWLFKLGSLGSGCSDLMCENGFQFKPWKKEKRVSDCYWLLIQPGPVRAVCRAARRTSKVQSPSIHTFHYYQFTAKLKCKQKNP